MEISSLCLHYGWNGHFVVHFHVILTLPKAAMIPTQQSKQQQKRHTSHFTSQTWTTFTLKLLRCKEVWISVLSSTPLSVGRMPQEASAVEWNKTYLREWRHLDILTSCRLIAYKLTSLVHFRFSDNLGKEEKESHDDEEENSPGEHHADKTYQASDTLVRLWLSFDIIRTNWHTHTTIYHIYILIFITQLRISASYTVDQRQSIWNNC